MVEHPVKRLGGFQGRQWGFWVTLSVELIPRNATLFPGLTGACPSCSMIGYQRLEGGMNRVVLRDYIVDFI